mgnify:CR=1 FL=1
MSDEQLSPEFETSIELDSYALSASVYAERSDGQILLLKRAEGTAMAGFYFLPGGLVDPGETPWEAASRELREESGLEFSQPPAMVGCYPMFVYGREFLQLTFRGPVDGDLGTSDEHTDHRWVDPTELRALFDPDAVAAIAAGDDRIAALLRLVGEDLERYLRLRDSSP